MKITDLTRILPLITWFGLGSAPVGAEEFEAVASRASADYVRVRQPDGSFQIESYAFGRGGQWTGPIDDKTINKMDFLKVAHVIASPLEKQNYIPGRDPKTTKLLIMVYWGTTYAPEHASSSPEYQIASDTINQIFAAGAGSSKRPPPGGLPPGDKSERMLNPSGGMSLSQSNAELDALLPVEAENQWRDHQDAKNAALLGYNSWWNTYAGFDEAGTAFASRKQELVDELEEDRYFVVLMAYDFQLMRTTRKHKFLWETRFSIREHTNSFEEKLPAMALEASRYFGQDSNGLTHKPLPNANVELGTIRNLGTVPEK